jgi:hypothetical protein
LEQKASLFWRWALKKHMVSINTTDELTLHPLASVVNLMTPKHDCLHENSDEVCII